MSKDHSLESRARIEKDSQGKSHRVICDPDLLELADILNTPVHQMYLKSMEKVFRQICNTVVENDGIKFDNESIAISMIREEAFYDGVRVNHTRDPR